MFKSSLKNINVFLKDSRDPVFFLIPIPGGFRQKWVLNMWGPLRFSFFTFPCRYKGYQSNDKKSLHGSGFSHFWIKNGENSNHSKQFFSQNLRKVFESRKNFIAEVYLRVDLSPILSRGKSLPKSVRDRKIFGILT